MEGACSRKRDQQEDEDNFSGSISRRYSKSGSSKWLATSFARPPADCQRGVGQCPSLMDLCIRRICKDIDRYNTFSMLPRDISQQIFNELVYSGQLTDVSLEAFRDCALQDLNLGKYPGVNDNWIDVISSQGSSLLSVDVSCSDVTDNGLVHLKDCTNLQALNFNYCYYISDHGLGHMGGLAKLESLNIKWCNCITDADLEPLSGLGNLKVLNLAFNDISDAYLVHLKGLSKLESLNLHSCGIGDEGLVNLTGLGCLESINLLFTVITDNGLRKLSRLTSLKSLNIDARQITDSGLAALTNFKNLKSLELCGLTDAGVRNIQNFTSLTLLNISQNCGLRTFVFERKNLAISLHTGLTGLVSLNVSNSRITSGALEHLKTFKNLKSLTLESCKVTSRDIKKLQFNHLHNLVYFRPE